MPAKAVLFVAAWMSPVGKAPSSSERAAFKLVNTMIDQLHNEENHEENNEENFRTFALWWRLLKAGAPRAGSDPLGPFLNCWAPRRNIASVVDTPVQAL